jgi:cytochrome c oxidase subunit II
MSDTAVIITVAYSITVVIGAAIAIGLWRSTRRRDLGSVDTARFARTETAWLFVMIVALVALLMGTIFYVPYGKTAGEGKQVVRVIGVQFAWSISPASVKAGDPVEFLATTQDVSHGFGVYREGVLQFQAQVISGETQKIVHTFDKPGTYDVLCLEFCGAGHHKMVTTLEVTPS